MRHPRAVVACLLAAAGAGILAYAGLTLGAAGRRQERAASAAEIALQTPPRPTADRPAREGDALGLLRIPSIDVSVAIFEGVSDETLLAGPGHLPWTAALGSDDVSVVAGHRDLHFRDLPKVRTGDRVALRLPGGSVAYRVAATEVTDPDDAEVVAPAGTGILRLVTCWPPSFVGPAPERLVVTALPVRRGGDRDDRMDVPVAAREKDIGWAGPVWLGIVAAAGAGAITSAAAGASDRRRWFLPWVLAFVALDASAIVALV